MRTTILTVLIVDFVEYIGLRLKKIDKIFQSSFATTPAGHGTGLGLSMSYDIIKAHGGELKVETEEGSGTEFTILLPQ